MSIRICQNVLDGRFGEIEGLVTNSVNRPTIGGSDHQWTPRVVLGHGHQLLEWLSSIPAAERPGVGCVP